MGSFMIDTRPYDPSTDPAVPKVGDAAPDGKGGVVTKVEIRDAVKEMKAIMTGTDQAPPLGKGDRTVLVKQHPTRIYALIYAWVSEGEPAAKQR